MRRTLPMVLLLLGVYLLVGCIPIPATQQLMVNGKLKPSYSIGSGEKSPVRLNHTRIDDAMNTIDQLVAGLQSPGNWMEGMSVSATAGEVRRRWVKLDDGRYVLSYPIRTATVIWPLCFTAETDWRVDYLILHVKNGVVVDYETTSHEEQAGIHDGKWGGYDIESWPLPTTRPAKSTRPSTGPVQ